MGKRKLHAQTYYQCDWTGLPMRATNCYMPSWNEAGKLVKHGSYCCWEAVIAHAVEQVKNDDARGEFTKPTLDRIREHVNDLVGSQVAPAPHWSELAWFAREGVVISSPAEFLHVCSREEGPVMGVRMMANGDTHEVLLTQEDIKSKFEKFLTRPYSQHTIQSFQVMRKKGAKDRDLSVFFWPYQNGLPFNETASNAFKMQIYGDVVITQQAKEPCFLPRERYINYFLSQFQEQFAAKPRKREHTPTLTTEDYALAKAQMASELQSVEQLASATASAPGDLAKAAVLPPPSGSELASLLKMKGLEPPKKKKSRLEPTVVPVEVA